MGARSGAHPLADPYASGVILRPAPTVATG
ncbi:MAG: hypothetical protein AVDCRST_MAG30-1732 [uncultured Solirubrobacteraceae bacterium]|uniref:Uncharacterized protein n=1 Tax=uncultured Solirubrobacteraceae bacterium TaxID=1162706 RepID=A0A6J4SFG5_9ACTN|nr:MAG: hypothetical protein AVDCRST_MAG30-1732 [uncultured Solirubrobacteraceae bacterium]